MRGEEERRSWESEWSRNKSLSWHQLTLWALRALQLHCCCCCCSSHWCSPFAIKWWFLRDLWFLCFNNNVVVCSNQIYTSCYYFSPASNSIARFIVLWTRETQHTTTSHRENFTACFPTTLQHQYELLHDCRRLRHTDIYVSMFCNLI